MKENILDISVTELFKTPSEQILPLLQILRNREEEKKESKLSEMCKKKKAYTKKEALTRKNELKQIGQIVRNYHCPICNLWHLTHKYKNDEDVEREKISFKRKGKIKLKRKKEDMKKFFLYKIEIL